MHDPSLIPISYTWVLALSAVLFGIGTLGVLLRRNGIAIFLSLEIMLNSANLAFAAFAMHFATVSDAVHHAALNGQLFIFFVIAVAAAEAAVGLALFIALSRIKGSIDVDRANILRW